MQKTPNFVACKYRFSFQRADVGNERQIMPRVAYSDLVALLKDVQIPLTVPGTSGGDFCKERPS